MATFHSAQVLLDLIHSELLIDGAERRPGGLRIREPLRLATGTDPGQIDVGWARTITGIAPSTTTPYNLVGSLKDREGNVLTFASTVLIAIKNLRDDALATVEIGPDAVNGHGVLATGRGYWRAHLGAGGGSVAHPAGGWVVAGYAPDGVLVGAGATDILSTITSAVAGSTNSYHLMVLGRTV